MDQSTYFIALFKIPAREIFEVLWVEVWVQFDDLHMDILNVLYQPASPNDEKLDCKVALMSRVTSSPPGVIGPTYDICTTVTPSSGLTAMGLATTFQHR
jgi:hypothetical protein